MDFRIAESLAEAKSLNPDILVHVEGQIMTLRTALEAARTFTEEKENASSPGLIVVSSKNSKLGWALVKAFSYYMGVLVPVEAYDRAAHRLIVETLEFLECVRLVKNWRTFWTLGGGAEVVSIRKTYHRWLYLLVPAAFLLGSIGGYLAG